MGLVLLDRAPVATRRRWIWSAWRRHREAMQALDRTQQQVLRQLESRRLT